MIPLLTVENLHTYYGASHVLFGVSLEVNENEVVVLLGRNGAGKTTTLKSIMGILECRSDAIRFRGDSIGGLSSDAVCRAGLGYVPEDCRIFRGLSVHENLEVARRAPRGKAKHTWTDESVFGGPTFDWETAVSRMEELFRGWSSVPETREAAC